ncbi:MAG: AmmeMemoRadiSam system protein A [Acidimicrobiales bacterium]
MAPSPSPEAPLAPTDGAVLLDIADAAIVDGLGGRPPVAPPLAALPPALRDLKGVFVTLTVDGELNGCIGTIEGVEALGHATARHAQSAAYADPRLPPLRQADYERLTIEVSVLSALEPIAALTRHDLLSRVRPRIDGLLIACGRRHGVFLPAVWEQLDEPAAFLDHLQLKAGLDRRRWPPGMRAWRFTAQKFARRSCDQPGPVHPADGGRSALPPFAVAP